jgi:hypothetical protein
MRHTLISVLLCVLITGAVIPARAATYKWTDENGQTIYSQTPPPSGTTGVEHIKGPPRSSADSKTATQKTKDDAAAFDERHDEQKTQEQDQKKMKQAEAERKKLCGQMRQDVETLTTKPVVRRVSENGGEPVVLTSEEREAEVKEMRERLKKECK